MIDLTPQLILTLWAGGIAGAAAAVAWWRVVGPGFIWLAGGVVLLAGIPAAAAGDSTVAAAGAVVTVVGSALAARPGLAAIFFAAAGLMFWAAGVAAGGYTTAVTGAVALGAMTTEMLLGHWYLVDPRLPRWPLRRLDAAAVAGVGADVAVLVVRGARDGDGVVVAAFVLLAVTSLALGVAVWFALGQPSYSGVMAATGLSYLAVLTVVGMVVVGRSLLSEVVL